MAEAEDHARRALGERLRQMRQAAGFSQHGFAPLTYYGRSTIANVEVGRQNVPRSFWLRCDEVLETGGVLTQAFDDLERLRSERLRAGASAGGEVQPSLPSAAADSDAPLEYLRRLEASSGRRSVGKQFPAYLRRRAARLRRLDDVLGGGDTFVIYQGEYVRTETILREGRFTDVVRKDLLSVLAEQAQQAGWAAFDAGNQAEALRLYRVSQQAAEDAGDRALHGNAYAFLAYQRLDRDPVGALSLADTSCQAAGSALTGSVGALLHERRAWAYAVAGDLAATEQALERAAMALKTTSAGPEPDWSRWVDELELQIMTGRCWAALRRPLRAVPILRAALANFDDTNARDKALYSSWLADSYLMAGEIEEAARVVDRALDLAADVASVRPGRQLGGVLSKLAGQEHLPVVKQVLEKARG